MGRRETLVLAIRSHQAAIGRVEAVPDAAKTASQWRSLAINLRTLIAYQAELAALPPADEPTKAAPPTTGPVPAKVPTTAPTTPPAAEPIELRWIETPWPEPDRTSVEAVLAKYGVEAGSAVPEGFIDGLTDEELVFLSASGIFGSPDHPNGLGKRVPDFSRFSDYQEEQTGAGFRCRLWHDGVLIYDEVKATGPDPVKLWKKLVG